MRVYVAMCVLLTQWWAILFTQRATIDKIFMSMAALIEIAREKSLRLQMSHFFHFHRKNQ